MTTETEQKIKELLIKNGYEAELNEIVFIVDLELEDIYIEWD